MPLKHKKWTKLVSGVKENNSFPYLKNTQHAVATFFLWKGLSQKAKMIWFSFLKGSHIAPIDCGLA